MSVPDYARILISVTDLPIPIQFAELWTTLRLDAGLPVCTYDLEKSFIKFRKGGLI